MRPALYSYLLSVSLVFAIPIRAAGHADIPERSDADTQSSAQTNSSPNDKNATPSTSDRQSVLPVGEETHHELLLKNDLINVYGINVPAQDKTLPYKHDFPSVTVSVGPSDVQTTVAGKASTSVTRKNGGVTFSEGGAQTIEAAGATTYRGVVVELLQQQGAAKNLCQRVVPGPLNCADTGSQQASAQPSSTEQASAQPSPTEQATSQPSDAARQPAGGKARVHKALGRGASSNNTDVDRRRTAAEDDDVPAFETDVIRVDLIRVSGGHDYAETKPKDAALLVALADANISVSLGGQSTALLHDGNVLWMPAGVERRASDFLSGTSSFILISFRAAPGK